MIRPLTAFAGGVFTTFAITAIESIEREKKYKETVVELQGQRATVTTLGQQIAWQNQEIALERERTEKAQKQLAVARADMWKGGMTLTAIGAVSLATIGAMVHEMR